MLVVQESYLIGRLGSAPGQRFIRERVPGTISRPWHLAGELSLRRPPQLNDPHLW
jgi:hypothetical protein